MTPDEIETRIHRLETQCTALTVLIHSVLPATVPAQRHLILQQFGQYSRATHQRFLQSNVPAHLANAELQELAKIYTGLEGALKLIEDYEAKKKPT